MTLKDNAVYVDGHRTADPASLEETYRILRQRHGMAWIGLYRPDPEEIRSVAREFGLHELAVEDAITAHQRPKFERYDTTLFTVLRPARYLDAVEEADFGELHVFTGRDFVVTIRHAEAPHLGKVRRRLESSPQLLRCGPEAILYAILDQVVDEYERVVAGLENDIDEISAWAAILFAPTLVASIYGMNFRHLPELHRAVGYPFALGLMLVMSVTLYVVFKRRRWL